LCIIKEHWNIYNTFLKTRFPFEVSDAQEKLKLQLTELQYNPILLSSSFQEASAFLRLYQYLDSLIYVTLALNPASLFCNTHTHKPADFLTCETKQNKTKQISVQGSLLCTRPQYFFCSDTREVQLTFSTQDVAIKQGGGGGVGCITAQATCGG
jgi:hypothetical protein